MTVCGDELLSVKQPAQYLGGETGSVMKRDEDVSLHICLAFPDTYEVGMSHTGYQILYDLINRNERHWAERAYAPLPDMERLLREKNRALCSLESQRPLSQFDLVGFSLQYELCMSGILAILELGGIPLLASEREERAPLVIGGGPVAYHPEPFADFFDCLLVGDGEELVPEFLAKVEERRECVSRAELLRELAQIKGVYVPALFEPTYDQDGDFAGMKPLLQGCESVSRRIISTLEDAPYPTKPLVPNIEVVHDRLSVEVMRGCVRGCRFCQAGYLYRPQRERKPEQIREIVKESLENSGYEELSLLSLSTADYCSVLPLLRVLKEDHAKQDELAVSFPSTRVDALTPDLLEEVQTVRRSGFTMAPEAGTQRLRDVINKGVTDEQIIETCSNVFRLGWSSVKLYFMLGLPTETDEDLQGIVELARRVKAIAGKRKEVVVSVSTHVPKPHTPFQWAEQIPVQEIIRRQFYIKDQLLPMRVKFRYHDPDATFLEGVFARGDRRLSRVIRRAYELGSRLEGWAERLDSDVWRAAFEAEGIEPNRFLKERDTDAPLPWEHISCDIPKRWFEKEWQRAKAVRTTPDCLTQTCSSCGTCDYDAVRNVLFDRGRTQERLGIVEPKWEKRRKNASPVSELTENGSSPEAKAAAKQYTLKEYLRTEAPPLRAQRAEAHSPVQRLRVRYSKRGRYRYFGHQETGTLFFRAFRQRQLPLCFSRGFRPKPKFAFGPALQLGVESEWEFFDVSLWQRVEPESLLQELALVLPEDLSVIGCWDVPIHASPVQTELSAAEYETELTDEKGIELQGWREIPVKRKRKGRSRTIPLGACVDGVSLTNNRIRFLLMNDPQSPTLKPREVTEALLGTGVEAPILKCGIVCREGTLLDSLTNRPSFS